MRGFEGFEGSRGVVRGFEGFGVDEAFQWVQGF